MIMELIEIKEILRKASVEVDIQGHGKHIALFETDFERVAIELVKKLNIHDVISSSAVQKIHFYSMLSTYLKASEEVENGIYDPIEDALQEIQQKYLIIQKTK